MSLAALRAEKASGYADLDLACSLADALRTEARLLTDLLEILSRQRKGVVTEDMALVDEAIYSAQRVFRTLGQARLRRRTLLEVLGVDVDVRLEDIEVSLGPKVTPEIGHALQELRALARTASGELEINGKALKGAMRSGERPLGSLPETADRDDLGTHGPPMPWP